MANQADYSSYLVSNKNGSYTFNLLVDGVHCAKCIWRIENGLSKLSGVLNTRLNLSTRRLKVEFEGNSSKANEILDEIIKLGYKAQPYDIKLQETSIKNEEKFIFKNLAVAGFASGNLMLLSFALWITNKQTMGMATREFFHLISAIIAIPAVIYSGRPFFYSALKALKNKATNMDVPISVALILTPIMSIFEMLRHGEHVYFDSAIMLAFFLLIGRWFDIKARGKAREAAQNLLTMLSGTATIIDGGSTKTIPIKDIKPNMVLLISTGEKVSADGLIVKGETEVDTSIITGETMPKQFKVNDKIFAGSINLSAPVEVKVLEAGEETLLSEIVRLMEKSEQAQAKYVRIADRVARMYTPVVHLLALLAFIGWVFIGNLAWQNSLLIATTVLIITCPCALALAVPVVQVLASTRLLRDGIILKSGDALERLASVDIMVFDKTGTLTLGEPKLIFPEKFGDTTMQVAASLAAHSKHPLSKALVAENRLPLLNMVNVKESQGMGLQGEYEGRLIKLGRFEFVSENKQKESNDNYSEIWLKIGEEKTVRFTFKDKLKPDAKETISRLKDMDKKIFLLSGDKENVVKEVADELGIKNFKAEVNPVEKFEFIKNLKLEGKVLMCGDGLNDAPSLASADVSLSPASAVDITQNSADIVFQGKNLKPVLTSYLIAKKANILVKENFVLSFIYNAIAIPFAFAGFITPLNAAIAMSASSLIVIANSFRVNRN